MNNFAGPVNFEFPTWMYFVFIVVFLMYAYLACGLIFIVAKGIKSVYKKNKASSAINEVENGDILNGKNLLNIGKDYLAGMLIDGIISGIIVAITVVPLYIEQWDTASLVYSIAFGCFLTFVVRIVSRMFMRITIGGKLVHSNKTSDKQATYLILVDATLLASIAILTFASSSSI